jgi:hypothetical protein
MCLQAAAAEAEAVLSKQRFQQLDTLLTRTGLYTNFLMEQMQVGGRWLSCSIELS